MRKLYMMTPHPLPPPAARLRSALSPEFHAVCVREIERTHRERVRCRAEIVRTYTGCLMLVAVLLGVLVNWIAPATAATVLWSAAAVLMALRPRQHKRDGRDPG